MSNDVYNIHDALKTSLKDYIITYLRRSPVLLEALKEKLDDKGILFQEPYIESSAEYEKIDNWVAGANIPDWMKEFFSHLIQDNLGVYSSSFKHQILALENAVAGKNLFVSTGTGSGKTECFIWPLIAKLVREAHDTPKIWEKRGVRCIIMYPMNALVSDQISRLRRLIGDTNGDFITHFRSATGQDIRRPQFGMYTGRTPYPGKKPKKEEDKSLAKTLQRIVNGGANTYISELTKQGRIPAKQSLSSFVTYLQQGNHQTDPDDAELITRFEMQQKTPDILITNYSMLEYMLFRPHERSIWMDTRAWLNSSQSNRLLFVIDEAHMYKGASGGEVALLLRRLFHKLGISYERVQFILTTASMPDDNDNDKEAVKKFANCLTASDENSFCYLKGTKKEIPDVCNEIPTEHIANFSAQEFLENEELTTNLNRFWKPYQNGNSFNSIEEAEEWLFDNLIKYNPFRQLMVSCRGVAVSFSELASSIFPNDTSEKGLSIICTLLSILSLAKKNGNILFPIRAHMLFRGIEGIFACSNPYCPHSHSDGKITLGEITFSSGQTVCPHCGSMIYELYRDRRCGALFFKGYILEEQFRHHELAYLWRLPGQWIDNSLKEVHLYIPPEGYIPIKKSGKSKITPCYLDIRNGFLHIGDDSINGNPYIRKLYYCAEFEDMGRPNLKTFYNCPHCDRHLGPGQILNFAVRGNYPFYNLIRAQFENQNPVPNKIGNSNLPNEGRKILLFSDSRQGAATLARDMSDASDITAARQLFALALKRMSQESEELTLNDLYGYFALEAKLHNVHMFSGDDGQKFWEKDCKKMYHRMESKRPIKLGMDSAPEQMQIQLLRLFCSGYNTASDITMAWLEPTNTIIEYIIEDLHDNNISTSRQEVIELFNAWILNICRDWLALGNQISDSVREQILQPYDGYGLKSDWKFPPSIMEIMKWKKDSPVMDVWKQVLEEYFLEHGTVNSERLYIKLDTIAPKFDMAHQWHRCPRCSGITAMPFKNSCPNCGSSNIQQLDSIGLEALNLWKKQIRDALDGAPIRIIDTEEHTAQLSYKDQRDTLWARTEEYELRFQDIVAEGDSPVDILSSTTTMEVGIDIGSLVAIGLRNMPPLRENYQQRAGRAGRRGSVLSTIVTFCENGPHDALYFQNPSYMLRGAPRRPWIDTRSSRLLQRHLAMVAIQDYCDSNQLDGLDEISATEFLSNHKATFFEFIRNWKISYDGILLNENDNIKGEDFRKDLQKSLEILHEKIKNHPELYEATGNNIRARTLLDALYDESIIPTYSFPKNVVSMYITDSSGRLQYQVSRGLDLAISEYAPGRSIVVDKNTYQSGGIYSYGSEQHKVDNKPNYKSPARAFFNDSAYFKKIICCPNCHWFGLASGDETSCPFCGNKALEDGRPMIRPWGFAPVNAKSISPSQLREMYSWTEQPLYSTLPESGEIPLVNGYKYMRVADRSGQRIIMLNNGGGNGFYVCKDCGAAVPSLQKSRMQNEINRPYVAKLSGKCRHPEVIEVDLGYDFITDMIVLECKLDNSKIDTQRNSAWLQRAAQSLIEALRLQACRKLDIEFTELVSGYRIRENKDVFIDLYLYDSLSSGAGYSMGLIPYLPELLRDTERFLSGCQCEDACHQCLKHYQNRHIHGKLDRFAALDFLHWCIDGTLAKPIDIDRQEDLLKPFLPILENHNISITKCSSILLCMNGIEKELLIYPAMWKNPQKQNTISISDAATKYARPTVLKTILKSFGV